MPAALSLDLRRRIVQAHLDGEASARALAQRFAVSESTVRRLLERHRTSGSIAPTQQKYGRTPRIQEEHRALFEGWLKQNVSSTQGELARRFTEETGIAVSQQTVSRSLARLRVTRKKSR